MAFGDRLKKQKKLQRKTSNGCRPVIKEIKTFIPDIQNNILYVVVWCNLNV